MAAVGLVKAAELAEKGRALMASKDLLPGQLLLKESPLLLYLEAHAAASKAFCCHCARSLPLPEHQLTCQSCGAEAIFCSPRCAALATASSHSPWACHALLLLAQSPISGDPRNQARFLISAFNLALFSPSSFQQLLLLQGEATSTSSATAAKVEMLHAFLATAASTIAPLQGQNSAPAWPPEFVAALLAKDEMNAFGLMAPGGEPGQRKVRAYAIYAQASLFNHDCLPNACRFEYVDNPGDGNTDICIRTLHEIREGTEICISYFPINWRFSDRQERLKQEYGFECKCERCKVERNWNDEDEDEDIAEQVEEEDIPLDQDENFEGDEEMEGSETDLMEDGAESSQGSFPHAMFFVKYLCPVENCGGTMAPLPPAIDLTPSGTMECNACGHLRTEEAFIADLEEHSICE